MFAVKCIYCYGDAGSHCEVTNGGEIEVIAKMGCFVAYNKSFHLCRCVVLADISVIKV